MPAVPGTPPYNLVSLEALAVAAHHGAEICLAVED